MKKIIILGSTGSIGKQTLEIIKKDKNKFKMPMIIPVEKAADIMYKKIVFSKKFEINCFVSITNLTNYFENFL